MTLREWILDKKVYFIIHTLTMAMLLIFLSVFGMNLQSLIFVCLMGILAHSAYLFYEFFRRYKFYKEIDEQMTQLDKKHYIHELMPEPYFFEGIFLQDLISNANKSMNDEIMIYKSAQRDYSEYIETWVHEIKTPVAASHLIIKNNPNPVTLSLKEELDRIDQYIEQALYYARGNHLEKDYVIRTVSLKTLVQNTVKKYSRQLIERGCKLELFDPDVIVQVDEKWLSFIIGQIMSNSIQYAKKPMTLQFTVKAQAHQVVLSIRDNGIGISQADLPRVFHKGFTGQNGRTLRKSTGMGLYLCQSLCEKMGLSIGVDSKENEYTEVRIHIPKSNMYV